MKTCFKFMELFSGGRLGQGFICTFNVLLLKLLMFYFLSWVMETRLVML